VRVNAISPGVIRAPNADGSDSATHPAEFMMWGTPAGGSGTPDAIAHAAVYLASDEAWFVHGSVIDVDGGRTGVAVVASHGHAHNNHVEVVDDPPKLRGEATSPANRQSPPPR
jgi:enoyl-[acyl-carrier-protein] reductase (NADH)